MRLLDTEFPALWNTKRIRVFVGFNYQWRRAFANGGPDALSSLNFMSMCR
jgi:hypothetical protein